LPCVAFSPPCSRSLPPPWRAPRWGLHHSFTPKRKAGSSGNTTFKIVSEIKYSGAGKPNSSAGGFYIYKFRASNRATRFYLTKVGSSTRKKVSRNTFVHYVQHHHGDMDPVAKVTKWSWKGSGS